MKGRKGRGGRIYLTEYNKNRFQFIESEGLGGEGGIKIARNVEDSSSRAFHLVPIPSRIFQNK